MGPVSRPAWGPRVALGTGGIIAASLALVAAGILSGASAGAAPVCAPASGNDFSGPPNSPVAKPAATIGLTTTIYWIPEPENYWDDTSPRAGGYAYIVNITNLSTCQMKSFHVPGGKTANQFTVSTSDFPAAAHAIDGTTFAYRLSATETYCQSSDIITHTCETTFTGYSDQSAPVVSLQDATAPVLQSLTLNNGLGYTNQLTVPAHLVAVDPAPPGGGQASGLGFIQFSPTGSFACAALVKCAVAYASDTTVALAPGPDGLRTVYARVFDQAQAPTSRASPVLSFGQPAGKVSTAGQPAGNVSNVRSAMILLDTTGPTLVVTDGPATPKVGQQVRFDGTQSSDPPAGSGPGSGIDAGTAVWHFGDGTEASGLAVTHAYTKAGQYVVSFSMRDRAGNLSTKQIPVVVKAATTTTTTTTTTKTTTTTATGTTTTNAGTPSSSRPSAPAAARITGLTIHKTKGRYILELRLSRPATVLVDLKRLRPRPPATIERLSRRLHSGTNQFKLVRLPRHSTERVLVAVRGTTAHSTSTRSTTITIR